MNKNQRHPWDFIQKLIDLPIELEDLRINFTELLQKLPKILKLIKTFILNLSRPNRDTNLKIKRNSFKGRLTIKSNLELYNLKKQIH